MIKQPAELDLLNHLAIRTRLKEEEFERMMSQFAALRSRSAEEDKLFTNYAETIGESLIHGQNQDIPDCRECGACCAYFHHIPVQPYDPTPRQLTWQVYETDDADELPARWMKRLPTTANCIALNGEIGGHTTCKIYEVRPVACRAFEAGSDRCHAVRRLFQLEEPLTVAERHEHETLVEERLAGGDDLSLPVVEKPECGGGMTALLLEMIDFNSGILQAIEAEIARMQTLFASRGLSHGVELCGETIQGITDNRLAIRDTRKQIELTPLRAEAGNHQLLQIGEFSQQCVESASHEVMQIGELWMEMTDVRGGGSRRCGEVTL